MAGTRMPMVGRPAVTIDAIPKSARARNDQGQRARPMRLGKRARRWSNTPIRSGGREVGNMDDQGIEGGPALGFVNPGDGLRIGRVGGEPVNRLGRDRDRLAGQDQARRQGDAVVVEGKDSRRPCERVTAAMSCEAGAIEAMAGRAALGALGSIRPRDRARAAACASGSPGQSSLRKRLRSESPRRVRAPGATNMPTPRLTTISPSSWKP